MKIIRVKKVCENCEREWHYEVEKGETTVSCRFCKHPLDLMKEIEVSKRNRRNRVRGKRNQRALKRFLGDRAEDRGILGGADVVHDQHFYIEAKELKKIPSGFMKFWLQATYHCPNGRVPCVQIHELNKRHEDDFVFMRLEDFKGEITEKGENTNE
jgi:hypothetical protein